MAILLTIFRYKTELNIFLWNKDFVIQVSSDRGIHKYRDKLINLLPYIFYMVCKILMLVKLNMMLGWVQSLEGGVFLYTYLCIVVA